MTRKSSTWLLVSGALLASVVIAALLLLDDEVVEDASVPAAAPLARAPAASLGGLPSALRSPGPPGAVVPDDPGTQQTSEPAAQPLQLAAEMLAVRVLGDHRPLGGAEAFLACAGHEPTRARSDREGRLQLEVPAREGLGLLVRAPGCAPTRVAGDVLQGHLATHERLEVNLVGVGRLFGRVTLVGDRPVPAGVTVLAWSTPRPPDRVALLAALQAAEAPLPDAFTLFDDVTAGRVPELLVTHTRQGGSFAFERPVARTRWTLEAGGLGIAGLARTVHSASGEPALITGRSAHGLLLRLVDGHGVAVPDVPGPDGSAWSAKFGDAYSTSFSSLVRALLGYDDPIDGEGCLLLEAELPHWEASCGPMKVTVKRPGFEQASLSVELPNLLYGLQERRVELLADGGRLGQIDLHLPGWSDAFRHILRTPDAQLYLQPEEGKSVQCRVAAVEDDHLLLSGIPHGTYSALLTIDVHLGELKVDAPVVVSDVPSRLSVPLDGMASLEVQLDDPQGRPFDGRVNISMLWEYTPGMWAGTNAGSFDGPPYRLDFLRPGSFQVDADMARLGVSGQWGGRSENVELVAGELARVRLRLQPR